MTHSRGMTLVEILIAAGIMSIVMLTFSQMVINQQKQTRALSEKLAILDFQTLLGKVLADGSVCKLDLTDTAIPANPGNPQKFTDTLPATIAPIPLTRIHASAVAAPAVFTSVGSALNQTLKISSIKIGNILKIAPQQYKAELQVDFSGGVQTTAPAITSIVLQTDGGAANPGRETITGCTLGAADDSGRQIGYARVSRSDYVNAWAPAIPMDDTVPQINEGTNFLSLNYTAKKANSKLFIMANIQACAATLNAPTFAIFAGAGPSAISAGGRIDFHVNQSGSSVSTNSINAEYTPGNTNPITYSVRAGRAHINGCTTRYWGGAAQSSLTIQEIAQ